MIAISIALSVLAIGMSVASVVLTRATERRIRINLEASKPVPADYDFVVDPDATVRKFNVV